MQTIRSEKILRGSDSAAAFIRRLFAGRTSSLPSQVAASPPAIATSTAAAKGPEPYKWILNPTIDILFSCGGMMWVFYAILQTGLSPSLNNGPAAMALWFAMMGGSFLFNNAHQPATLFRVYFSQVTRKAMGGFCTVLAVIAVVICTPALFNHMWASIIFKLTLLWGAQHLTAQAFGISLIYCYKRGYFPSKREKDVLFAMMNLAWIVAAIRMLTYRAYGEGTIAGFTYSFFKVFPDWVCKLTEATFFLSVGVFCVLVGKRYFEKKQMFPYPALLTVATGLLMSVADKTVIATWLLFTPYFHSTQYLVVSAAFYFKERGLPEGVPLSKISCMLLSRIGLSYFLLLSVIGYLISVSLPNLLNSKGIPVALAFGGVYCMLNLHHYLTDAFIWKLRDPQIRKLLVA